MSSRRLASVLSVAVALSTPAFAQDAGSAPGPTGFRGDYLGGLGYVQKEIMSLEEAMPQAKFTWRPAKGVRSVAEVYLHIAGGIYFLAGQMGREMPADVKAIDPKKWDTQTTKKDEIKAILTKAFAFLSQTVKDTSDADLDKMHNFFGRDVSERALFMIIYGHCWEHLGQSIAYARSNGVVPPWSKPGTKD
jgi:uncharacterized damage-inducible protein DinB